MLCIHLIGIITNPLDSLFTYNAEGSWNVFYRPAYEPAFAATFNDSGLEEDAIKV